MALTFEKILTVSLGDYINLAARDLALEQMGGEKIELSTVIKFSRNYDLVGVHSISDSMRSMTEDFIKKVHPEAEVVVDYKVVSGNIYYASGTALVPKKKSNTNSKRCPQCRKGYPLDSVFCSEDGSKLVQI